MGPAEAKSRTAELARKAAPPVGRLLPAIAAAATSSFTARTAAYTRFVTNQHNNHGRNY
jgi:hypothetical protein